ncbi:potassium-transporting ATPase subunit KdpC [Acerihabitans sp. TG2]|uniref:potassium-transporting ATPase subunit KdpC n=1 Tax=Acerihabitans sp. TG2 TaxID=3096008 RepID=UPI002B22D5E5|nr:potassium-transporting ATPase subunit KdpC [Acerihabitans sp. TG2]MEA9391613.1 potassium-transporting ATPase subunit KdpC [Acerihabitans sp. TG2]
MSQLRPAVMLLILLSVITGVVYPLLTTELGHWFFPQQAEGSLLNINGVIRGSTLIGQSFTRADYFQGRPSATGDGPYNPLASSGSNLAASNPALDEAVKQRVAALKSANPQALGPVPVDLVTASASGLDPDISPQAALWQEPRISAARKLPPELVRRLINDNTMQPLLRFIGDPTVNILKLNVALDNIQRP